eukprot:2141015-Rhodomonas_salina.1
MQNREIKDKDTAIAGSKQVPFLEFAFGVHAFPRFDFPHAVELLHVNFPRLSPSRLRVLITRCRQPQARSFCMP